ncbi:integration host factor subunit alpha [Microvirga sp. KLBC 81]|uniref:integration host factor subunit alpha n=1 Tax=Microvirga sp. KLBC 81 TaxID=1862707 RepID=UPI000D513379|nr:integration host factor subunit alpha [Microvirga sp. KLBC 81]PVE24041.1 integration host factor subunit alpha [Microvirga sp. KLBC 81]
MVGKNVTREELMEAVRQQLGLSRAESTEMVQQVLEGICATLAAGETMKLSGFGTFTAREKGQRVGRNPKTGVEVPIEPRRVIRFNPSPVLKAHINGNKKKPRSG